MFTEQENVKTLMSVLLMEVQETVNSCALIQWAHTSAHVAVDSSCRTTNYVSTLMNVLHPV